jgi:hypothetical protein
MPTVFEFSALIAIVVALGGTPAAEGSVTCSSEPGWNDVITLIDSTITDDKTLLESTRFAQSNFLPPSQDEFLKYSIQDNPGLFVAGSAAYLTMWSMGLATPCTVPVAVGGMTVAGITIPAQVLILMVIQKQKARRAEQFLSSLDRHPSPHVNLKSDRSLDINEIRRYLSDYLTATTTSLRRLTRAMEEITLEDLQTEDVDPDSFRYSVLDAKMKIYRERITKLRSLRQFIGEHCRWLRLDRLSQ